MGKKTALSRKLWVFFISHMNNNSIYDNNGKNNNNNILHVKECWNCHARVKGFCTLRYIYVGIYMHTCMYLDIHMYLHICGMAVIIILITSFINSISIAIGSWNWQYDVCIFWFVSQCRMSTGNGCLSPVKLSCPFKITTRMYTLFTTWQSWIEYFKVWF